jgi:hypothetical protein
MTRLIVSLFKYFNMKLGLFISLLWIAAIIGEIRCLYQFFTSDFKPSYKRECVYGISAFTGLGVIVGYINIADEPEVK